MILTIRTWAVWNRNRRLTIILPILFVLVWGLCFIFLGKFLISLRCEYSYFHPTLTCGWFVLRAVGDRPYPEFKGCFVTHADKFLEGQWALLMIWNACMCKSPSIIYPLIARAQVKSRGIPVPTVPCLHGRHGNCTVGTGIARLALGIAQ